jgi:transitional endoplasmic reticulum ATPase
MQGKMSSNDEFIHISTGPGGGPGGPASGNTVSQDYFANTKGDRQYTEGYIVASIRQKHPKHHLTISPAYSVNLVAFADSRDDAMYFPHGDANETMRERQFLPPARRYNDETGGSFIDRVIFACYDYVFKGNTFLVYIVDGHDGPYHSAYNYILVEDLKKDGKPSAQDQVDELLAEAAKWTQDLHGEVFVFDNGFWQKNKDLWQNIQKSNWEDVILEKEKKEAIIEDVIGFFDSEKRYEEFGVPWKASMVRSQALVLKLTELLERCDILWPSRGK